MALTPARWLAAFVAGSLFLMCFGLNLPEDPWFYRQLNEYRRLRAADRTAKVAAARLRTSIVVDSAKRALARMPATDTSRWIVSAGFDTRQMAAIRRLQGHAAVFRVGPATNGIDVMFVVDDPGLVRGVQVNDGYSHTTLFPNRAGDRCVVLARLAQGRNITWLSSREFASRVVGPCAYYEAYGTPGPQIDRWLRDGAWRLGRLSAGDRALGLWVAPSNTYRNRWEAEGGYPLREYVALSAATCLAGNSSGCESVLLSSSALGSIPLRAGNSWTVGWYGADDGTALGPYSAYFLSEMAHNIGPERFKRFWTSTADPVQAFRDATGQELGQWTADWTRRKYGNNPVGPGVPASQASLSITLIVLGAIGAMLIARRRQMSF
jgi:hypothetical protein